MDQARAVLTALTTLAARTLLHESTGTITYTSRTDCKPSPPRRDGWVVEVMIRVARTCCRS